MLSFTRTVLAIVAASSALVSVSAVPTLSTVQSALVRRQESGGDLIGTIPAACNSTCSSTLVIYDYCQTGNATGCLQICTSASLNNFYTCINCAVQQGNVSAAAYSSVMETATTLAQTCKSAGQTGTATVSLVPLASARANATSHAASASASASSTAKATGAASAGPQVQLGAAVVAGAMALMALAL